jgi:hypothetical protein
LENGKSASARVNTERTEEEHRVYREKKLQPEYCWVQHRAIFSPNNTRCWNLKFEVLRLSPVNITGVQTVDLIGYAQNDSDYYFALRHWAGWRDRKSGAT